MARTSKVDACLICGEVPCVCGKPSKPAPKPRTPKKDSPVPVASPRVDAIEAMRARASTEVRAPVVFPKAPPARKVPEEDTEFRNALAALAPLLHPEELTKYAALLPKPETRVVSQRAADWRSRVQAP